MQEPGYMRAPRFTTATFGLRLALRLFEKTNNDVTTTTSTVSNPLLHVRRPRSGWIACCRSTTTKKKAVLVSEQPRARAREKACSKIKLLLVLRVDATHHSTGPTCLPVNLAERPAVYNIFAPTSNIYPPQIKIYVVVCIVLMQRPGSPPFSKKKQIKIYIPVLTRWACKLQSPGWQVGPEDYFN